MLTKGDNFIRKSKYGTCFGIVDEVYSVFVTNLKDLCYEEHFKIKSTNGVHYDVNECFKIKNFIDKEYADRYTRTLEMLKKRKLRLENNV